MTDEQIHELARKHTWFNGSHAMTNYPDFARAVIAAHEQARGQPEDLLALRKAREALVELVALKELKERVKRLAEENYSGTLCDGSTDWPAYDELLSEFMERKPIAWANARAALAGAGESK